MAKPTQRHRIPPAILHRSRDFRHPLTPTEAEVWQAVRRRQLGFKFRRQHPIGRFVADFYCAEASLVIEIDGDSHAPPDQAAYDAARTRWLEERGYRVIRFAASEVEDDLAGVVRPSLCSGCCAKGIRRRARRGLPPARDGGVEPWPTTHPAKAKYQRRRETQVLAVTSHVTDRGGPIESPWPDSPAEERLGRPRGRLPARYLRALAQ